MGLMQDAPHSSLCSKGAPTRVIYFLILILFICNKSLWFKTMSNFLRIEYQ